jgi:hypothetical protein
LVVVVVIGCCCYCYFPHSNDNINIHVRPKNRRFINKKNLVDSSLHFSLDTTNNHFPFFPLCILFCLFVFLFVLSFQYSLHFFIINNHFICFLSFFVCLCFYFFHHALPQKLQTQPLSFSLSLLILSVCASFPTKFSDVFH